jgi:hypothetical protein
MLGLLHEDEVYRGHKKGVIIIIDWIEEKIDE